MNHVRNALLGGLIFVVGSALLIGWIVMPIFIMAYFDFSKPAILFTSVAWLVFSLGCVAGIANPPPKYGSK